MPWPPWSQRFEAASRHGGTVDEHLAIRARRLFASRLEHSNLGWIFTTVCAVL